MTDQHGYRLGVKGQRQRRLDRIAQQVERGELIIRQASDAEREQWRVEREQRERHAASAPHGATMRPHAYGTVGRARQSSDTTVE